MVFCDGIQVECPKFPGFCITRQKNDYPFIEIFHSPEQVGVQSIPCELILLVVFRVYIVCHWIHPKIFYFGRYLLSNLWPSFPPIRRRFTGLYLWLTSSYFLNNLDSGKDWLAMMFKCGRFLCLPLPLGAIRFEVLKIRLGGRLTHLQVESTWPSWTDYHFTTQNLWRNINMTKMFFFFFGKSKRSLKC